jgi:hypothetical protein
MHWARFLAYNAVGAALWVGLWTSVGYFAGDHITPIYNAFTKGGLYVLIALVVLLAAYIARRVIRARRGRAQAAEESKTPSAETGTTEAKRPAQEQTSEQAEDKTPAPPTQRAAEKTTAHGQPAPASVPHPPPPEPETAADRSEDPASPS